MKQKAAQDRRRRPQIDSNLEQSVFIIEKNLIANQAHYLLYNKSGNILTNSLRSINKN
jgi:hypothetical protein